MRKIIGYGWKRDLPDFRDVQYIDAKLRNVVSPVAQTPIHNTTIATGPQGVDADGMPFSVSLRPHMPEVWDQGQLGSCTAHALSALFTYVHGGGPYSRLGIYYNERALEGTVSVDNGAYIRDGIKVLVTEGAGLEQDWPYDITKFTVAPPPVEITEEAQNRAVEYSHLMTRDDFRHCLSQGFPFVVGISIFESFENPEVAQTGIVPMPSVQEKMLGGHAICVVGYNSNFNGGDYYLFRNSWGPDWSPYGGYGWLPAQYIENPNLASDAWTIRK